MGRMRWAFHVIRMGGEGVYTGFWCGKRPLGRFRHRWEMLSLYTWQHISHLLHVVNQGVGKFSLTTHTKRFRAAEAATAAR